MTFLSRINITSLSTLIAYPELYYQLQYSSLHVAMQLLRYTSYCICDTAGFHLEILVWGGSGRGSFTNHVLYSLLPLS